MKYRIIVKNHLISMSEYTKEIKFPDLFIRYFVWCSFLLRVVIISDHIYNLKGYD